MLLKKKEKFIKEPNEIDSELLMYIQPRGGISFKDEKIIKTGDGYEVCIHVYAISSDYKLYWLKDLTNIQNVMTTIDIATADINEIKKNISKSIDENEQRKVEAKHHNEYTEAQRRSLRLQQLYTEIEEYGEVIKLVHIRLFVFDSVLSDLETRCEKILAHLDTSNYQAIPFVNETYKEYSSMLQPYEQQQKSEFPVEPVSITGHDLANGLPFYFSSLRDPMGTHFGYTNCGGVVLFDYFLSDAARKSFSSLVFGSMGMGKSTLLKKILLDRAARGDYLRVFDITGEFTFLGREYGAMVYKLDGSEGIINPLEILKTSDVESMNYVNQISKLKTMYSLWKNDASTEEKDMYERVLNELYTKWNLGIRSGENNVEHQITGLPPKAYPTFSDLYEVIEEKKERLKKLELAPDVKSDIVLLNNISTKIHNIIITYGNILNGISTFKNFSAQQIVIFDISTIKDIEPGIFDSLVVNMITECWDGATQNGSYYKNLIDQGKITLADVIHTLIIVDEAPKWINTRKLFAVALIKQFLAEGRKWFAGIIMAAQTIRDYVPEGSESGIDELKAVFELCQYKFVFRQDSNTIPLLRQSFDGQLTETELGHIPYMLQGECVMIISGVKNIDLNVFATKEELSMFRGGA